MKKIFFLMIVVILIMGCFSNYIPIKTKNTYISEDYSVFKNEKILIAVKKNGWNTEPYDVKNYYLPMKVIIHNKNNKPLKISKNDFHLVIENKNQYEPISPRQIINFHYSEDRLNVKKYEFNEFDTMVEDKNNIKEARINIMENSLDFGKILPGSKKTGFIFFKKLPSKNKKFDIFIKNKKFTFKKTK